MLLSIGCEAIEGRGSRVQFVKGAARANFHRQHPGKEAKRYQVRDARACLTTLGVTP